GVWLHRNEKAPVPPPGTSPWGVIVDFTRGSPEGYRGEPEKVQADGDGLKITLPPAGKEEKRGTRVLRISRDGDKLEVRVTGGCGEGTYTLKRVASKQGGAEPAAATNRSAQPEAPGSEVRRQREHQHGVRRRLLARRQVRHTRQQVTHLRRV